MEYEKVIERGLFTRRDVRVALSWRRPVRSLIGLACARKTRRTVYRVVGPLTEFNLYLKQPRRQGIVYPDGCEGRHP